MKKILTTVIAITGTACAARAEGGDGLSEETFRTIAVIFVMLSFMVFILAIIKKIIDYRLKNKIVDKGISEEMASTILRSSPAEGVHANVKWFALLAGIGAGLMVVNYTQPLGFHSIAIMAFSISLSFLGYFLYLRNTLK